MIEQLLAQDEGKTLEFKENAKSLTNIIRTVVAFANTAGGTLIIGVRDGSKNVVGVPKILQEEERIACATADSVSPQLFLDIAICPYRNHELLVIQVPHLRGPFFVKTAGLEREPMFGWDLPIVWPTQPRSIPFNF